MKKVLILMVFGLFTVLAFDSCKTVYLNGDESSVKKISRPNTKAGDIAYVGLKGAMLLSTGQFGANNVKMNYSSLTNSSSQFYLLGGSILLFAKSPNTTGVWRDGVFVVTYDDEFLEIEIENKTPVVALAYDTVNNAILFDCNEEKLNCYIWFQLNSKDDQFHPTALYDQNSGQWFTVYNDLQCVVDPISFQTYIGFEEFRDGKPDHKYRKEKGVTKKKGVTTSTNQGNFGGGSGYYFAPNTGNNNNSNNSNSNNGVFKNNSSTGTGNTGTGINLPD